MQPLYLHFSLHPYLNLKVDMNKITFMMAAVLTLALTACGRSSSARSPLGDEGGHISINGDTATLTFIHSTWSLIEEGAKWEFKRK